MDAGSPSVCVVLMTIHKVDSSIEHQCSQVSTVGSKGSSMQSSCTICGYVFKTRKDLLHHVEIAYRFKYHDHLVLQQIRPIHESVPSDFHAQLIQLNFYRHTLREVAEEMEVDGDEVGIFAYEPVTLDPHEQRERERSTPPLGIQIPTDLPVIVVKPAENGTVFNPYTTSSPYNYDPKSSTQARVTPPPKDLWPAKMTVVWILIRITTMTTPGTAMRRMAMIW